MDQIAPVGLRMPPEIKAWIAAQAKKERMSMNSFIVRLIEKTMEGKHAPA